MASTKPAKPRQPAGPVVRTLGLRERKKLKTRESIQRAALRLFRNQGYDDTTIEQIAAAVEISPSTFFNYFETKEDVVLLDVYDPMTIEMFRERPKDEPLSVTFRLVLQGLNGILERDRELILARGGLLTEVPALRARFLNELERNQEFLIALFAGRTGRRVTDFELRVVTRAVIGAAYEAMLSWMHGGGRGEMMPAVNRALDVIDADGLLDALAPAKPRRRGPGAAR
jgi:AcrR family transcriptional regulator